MPFRGLHESSLIRAFALLSLAVIALITAVQVAVQWLILQEDLLAWERTTTADELRRDAYTLLRPEDFVHWDGPEAQQRFARFFEHALFNPEILRVKLYGADMRVVWSDESRLLGVRFPENAHLKRALGGQVVAQLEYAQKAENVYERSFARTVELYVPLVFPGPSGGGSPEVAGVVEIYKDPSSMFANLTRDRLIIVAASVAGALVLYGALFWIVRRASRQLQAQRHDLERQAVALGAANEELRATQAQLRAAERLAAIGEVSAAVAHGIRNPLANIRAAAQVAQVSVSDAGVVGRYLGTITAEVDRLGGWIRALLEAIRPVAPRVVSLDVNVLLEDVLAVLAPRIGEGRITVERRLVPGLPALHGDRVQLEQALLCVLENAVDALPPGGCLAVTSERAGTAAPAVCVTVRDTGQGIPPERLARVFDLFYTTKTRGTGLGLAIARKVVERHGGRIDIESAVGEGTTVRVILPLEAPASAEAA